MIDSASSKKKAPPINVGAQRVAAIYAEALVGATEKAGQTDALVAELVEVAGAVSDHPQLQAVFASALVPVEEKIEILGRIFGSRVSPLLLDFLKVVARHGRLDIVPAIEREVQKLYDKLRGRVRVELQTATPLDDGFARSLESSLTRILGGQPHVDSSLDPSLIGGVVLRVGDTVYDGSVARQLRQVREQMITRSVHEIQSRRDRVRHSGGN